MNEQQEEKYKGDCKLEVFSKKEGSLSPFNVVIKLNGTVVSGVQERNTDT